ncbi:4Fe-4S binding protein [Lacrimispora saccharolytica]|nr:4Fe-4S binding protein [Lacrimispora saccharolytica]QRV20550.1 4Fe-4S binding protein [Lacrimispora saccharolytica]
MAAKVNVDRCIGCRQCEEICPVGAISMANEKAVINDDCIECGACISTCP